jgi:hypothetical protein
MDAPGTMISDALLPGFTPFIPVRLTSFPFKGMPPGPVYVVDFIKGYMHGFVIDAALTGRYRAENDAQTRALNGTVQQWPNVPLAGSIVHEIPGTLEVYEYLWDFGLPPAAQAWLTDRKLNEIMNQYPQVVAPAGVPPGFVVYRYAFTDPTDAPEHVVVTFGVRGSIGFSLSVQGGDQLSWADARPLVTAAYADLTAACPDS